jgi:hypothetical protein
VTDPTYWGQLRYNPLRVRESRLSWRLDTHRSSFGSDGRIRSPGVRSRAATLRESEDCACRGLDACCNPFGGGRTAPKSGLISGAATPRAKSAVATSDNGPRLLRETRLRPDVSACLGRASLGRFGETVPPSGGACEDSADGRRTSRAAFGWRDADAVRNANVRPRPLSGGTVTAVVQRRHQPRRCGMAPSGVSARLTVAVRWITCMGPGPTPNQIVRLSMLSARKGGHARRRDECLQLRCKRIEPFEPARSFSCLRSAPQADVAARSPSVSAHTQSGCYPFHSVPQGS